MVMDTKKISIGAFVIGGLVLFGVGMFLIGDQHQAFARHLEFYSEFANLAGLSNGAKVRVAGMDAGQVVDITVPDSPSSRFRVRWKIDERLRGLVRTDSVATIATEGVVGGTYLAVGPGSTQAGQADSLATIPSKETKDISDLVASGAGLLNDAQGTLKDIGPKLVATLDTLNGTVSNVNDVVVGLKEGRGTAGMLLRDQDLANVIRRNVTSAISNLTEVVADLKQGRGAAGMLLRDETLAGQVRQIVKNAEQASADLGQAARQADSMVSDLNSRGIPQKTADLIDSISDSARQVHQIISEVAKPDQNGTSAGENIRESIANASAAASNLAEATEALKHNFLVRGFFKKRGYYNLADISPDKYRNDRVFISPANRRAWLSGSDLFQSGANGDEELSAGGKALLNAALVQYGDSVLESPIVVEGYRDGNVPADQLRLSRSRAMLVRQYLQTHFQLDTSNLGIVAMRNSPPSGTNRATWDGICLVVLLRRN
jgi:phospholipid/cholesterol/gamma-HCH transport system substrate-binding protein